MGLRLDCHYICLLLHGSVAGLGALVLVGWGFHIEPLMVLGSQGVLMKPFAALFFLVCGSLGIVQILAPHRLRSGRFFAGSLVLLLSAIFSFQSVSSVSTGVEHWLFSKRIVRVDPQSHGLMALGTSLSFMFLAASHLAQLTARQSVAAWLLLPPLCLGGLAILGYGYGLPSLYAYGGVNAVALATATGLCMSAIASWCSQHNNTVMTMLASGSPHARALRRIGPPLVLVPFLLGILQAHLVRDTNIGPAMGTAAVTLVEIAILTGLLAWHLRTMYREQVLRAAAETEREQYMHKLAENEERLRLALAAGNMGWWELDCLTERNRMSPETAAYFGLPRDSTRSTLDVILRRIHPDDRAAWQQAVQTALATAGCYSAEYRVVWPDGSIHWLASRGRFFGRTTGKSERAVGIVVDITERKEAELKLAEAQEKLREHARTLEARVEERTAALRETVMHLETFSYSITHDMRGPLRAISGFAGILESDYGPRLDETARMYLHRLSTAAERLDSLIQDVLDFSRISKGDMAIETIDLAQLINDIVQQYPNFAAHRDRIDIRCVDCHVRGNLAALTQAISNLLANALKFVPAGQAPEVRLECERVEEYLRLWVIDKGIGIAPEYREKIWGAFQRLHQNEDYPGTGIGLAIVRKAVERMGGRVGVESNPGQGSRFWIDLPRAHA